MMTANQQQDQNMPAPIIMWRAHLSPFGLAKIEKVECSKVTDKSVFIVTKSNIWYDTKPYRCNRVSECSSYHETWAEAHAALLAYAERELNDCRSRLERLRCKYGNVKGMKPPADAEAQP
ncbi:MAG: hypothetical protein ACO3C6_10880 [Steroidobacteraceae bacterium]